MALQVQKQKYIKSFSKGQITVPKEFRDELGLGDDFWLKLYINQNKIIAEPVNPTTPSSNYANKLLAIDGSWLSEKELGNTRKEINKRLEQNEK